MPSRPLVLLGPLAPPAGGVATFMETLAANLAARGIEHRVLRLVSPGERPAPGEVAPTPRSILRLLARLPRGAVVLDSAPFLEYPTRETTLPWLAVTRLRRVRWVKVIHDGTLPARWAAFTPEQRRLARAGLRRAHALVAVGADLGDWVAATARLRMPPVAITPLLPPPPAGDAPPPEPLLRARARHERLVCATGAFTPAYGFAAVADAVERLREEGRDVGLVLVESSFSRDPGYERAVLRDRGWILRLEDVPHTRMRASLAACDAFVRATERESYGVSRVEAVLAGTSALGTPAGETRGQLLFRTPQELRDGLRRALDGDVAVSGEWAAAFAAEAERNLRALLEAAGRPPC